MDPLTDLRQFDFRVFHSFHAPMDLRLTHPVVLGTLETAAIKKPRHRGRPRVYGSNAEKLRAYRQRKKQRSASGPAPNAAPPPPVPTTDRFELFLLATAASLTHVNENSPSNGLPPSRSNVAASSPPAETYVPIDLFGFEYDSAKVLIDWSTVCSGLGVFAKADIEKDEVLTAYEGPRLSHTSALKDLPGWATSHYKNLSYMREVIEGIRVPAPGRGIASFANSARGVAGRSANACFSKSDNGVHLTSLCPIRLGEEILVDYLIRGLPEVDGELPS
jgi:hypothetical protein